MFFCIPCLALLIYFGAAGIFFPKYRVYLKDAWTCFIDKLRGRKCPVSFDNKMRLALAAWLADKGMSSAGKFFYNERNFKIVLTTVMISFSILSIYLFILFMGYLYQPPCVDNVCVV